MVPVGYHSIGAMGRFMNVFMDFVQPAIGTLPETKFDRLLSFDLQMLTAIQMHMQAHVCLHNRWHVSQPQCKCTCERTPTLARKQSHLFTYMVILTFACIRRVPTYASIEFENKNSVSLQSMQVSVAVHFTKTSVTQTLWCALYKDKCGSTLVANCS